MLRQQNSFQMVAQIKSDDSNKSSFIILGEKFDSTTKGEKLSQNISPPNSSSDVDSDTTEGDGSAKDNFQLVAKVAINEQQHQNANSSNFETFSRDEMHTEVMENFLPLDKTQSSLQNYRKETFDLEMAQLNFANLLKGPENSHLQKIFFRRQQPIKKNHTSSTVNKSPESADTCTAKPLVKIQRLVVKRPLLNFREEGFYILPELRSQIERLKRKKYAVISRIMKKSHIANDGMRNVPHPNLSIAGPSSRESPKG